MASRLIIDKEEFEKVLKDRIEKGKAILGTTIHEVEKDNYYGYGNRVITYEQNEVEAFEAQFRKWDDYNLELLKQAFDDPENEYRDKYNYVCDFGIRAEEEVSHTKKSIQKKINALDTLIEMLPLIPSKEREKVNHIPDDIQFGENVFIVHGHNVDIKVEIACTIEKLGLKPIILHEQADKGRTIIEKFEDKSNDVGFAVILLTDDDLGKDKNNNEPSKPRARQNVVLEMGYFIAKLGRERTFLLLSEGVEKPGDLDGIIYTPLDSNGAWKMGLVKELQNSGYTVDANNLLGE
ncbi:MAG: nucleotide-binding protein [Prevotellaceae bacterium]|nr:nucleotide-binding protein [Prevotellaceae bacterium]